MRLAASSSPAARGRARCLLHLLVSAPDLTICRGIGNPMGNSKHCWRGAIGLAAPALLELRCPFGGHDHSWVSASTLAALIITGEAHAAMGFGEITPMNRFLKLGGLEHCPRVAVSLAVPRSPDVKPLFWLSSAILVSRCRLVSCVPCDDDA